MAAQVWSTRLKQAGYNNPFRVKPATRSMQNSLHNR